MRRGEHLHSGYTAASRQSVSLSSVDPDYELTAVSCDSNARYASVVPLEYVSLQQQDKPKEARTQHMLQDLTICKPSCHANATKSNNGFVVKIGLLRSPRNPQMIEDRMVRRLRSAHGKSHPTRCKQPFTMEHQDSGFRIILKNQLIIPVEPPMLFEIPTFDDEQHHGAMSMVIHVTKPVHISAGFSRATERM